MALTPESDAALRWHAAARAPLSGRSLMPRVLVAHADKSMRQLLNVVEQSVALAATEVIPESLVRQALDVADTALTPLDEARKAFERDYLVRILKITGGNVTKAARLAGRNRTEFYRLLERHSLEPGMFKGTSHKEKTPA